MGVPVHAPSPMIESALALVRRAIAREDEDPVVRYESAEDLTDRIDFTLPTDGLDDEVVSGLLDLIADATPRTASPRFLNQLFGGRDDAAIAGELLSVVLNVSMYTFKVAGANAIIERELTGHMAGLIGFDRGEGVFSPGGSMSNFTAILMARNESQPTVRQRGLDGAPMTLYTSAQSHYSISKGAAMAGVGRDSLRRVPCDARGRMIPEALGAMIERDRDAGFRPFMINATAGTTVLGAFDPIREIAAIARRAGVWLHVDGAMGAGMILSERTRGLLDGVELADSITWDAHKLMGAPLVCSVILTREPGLLQRNFDEDAEYLFQSDSADVNFGGRSLQCGRRNDALKLWALWKRHGDRGLGRRMDCLMGLARYAAGLVRAAPELTLIRDPESVNVCFTHRDAPSPALCEELRRRRALVVGYAEVDGRSVIRAPFVNPTLTEDDVRAAIDAVREIGCELGRELREAPTDPSAPDARSRCASQID